MLSIRQSAQRRSPLTMLAGVVAMVVGCGGKSPTAPVSSADQLSEVIETASTIFRFAPGDEVDAERQQQYHEWAVARLGVSPPRKVTFNKYRDRAHMGLITGHNDTNGYADPSAFAIHTIWPWDNHEVVHLYTSLWGETVALFNEGIAVAFETDPGRGDLVPRWGPTAVHDLAAAFRRDGRLIPIDALLVTNGFFTYDSNVTYPEAGSFVLYLIDTYGLDPIRGMYGGNHADSAAVTRQRVQSLFGRSVAALEQEWWTMLDAR